MTSSPASPLISIVTPVYNTPLYALEECIASVFAQTYTNWQLCLVDDQSPRQETRDFLARAARQDSRIVVSHRATNGGIVAASNDAVAFATGDYIGLLDHDDVLEPDALAEVVAALHADPSIDYIYTDEDLLQQDGTTRDQFRKPDWSPERFRNQMYVCHFSVIKTSLMHLVGGFRPGFDGSQDYDLMLRVTEKAHKIHHIPKILYHWRVIDGSVAADPTAKPYAYSAGQRAVEEHCHRVGIAADISLVTALPGNYHVVRQDDPDMPQVTVLLVDTGAESSVWGDQRRHAPETAFHLKHMSTFRNLTIDVRVQGSQSRTEVLNRAVQECSTDFIVLASEALGVDT
ncbi:MAG: glycosyltransferase, partial [Ilumatobacteraceae bacterium]|nr:glycosyltransferase [Ilumatobacteraceae bacterium]